MSTQPSLLFQIRPGQYYGLITLESVQADFPVPPTGNLLQPPLPQPILDLSQGPIGQAPQNVTLAQLTQGTNTAKVARPYQRWFMDLWRWVTQGPSGGPSALEIVAPSIDETDIGWFGNGSINATDDPASFTATLTGSSRFGLQLQIAKPGSGYTSPVITITDANGNTNDAAATATESGGFLDSVVVTNSGFGLVPPITVTVTDGGPGTGAVVTADLGRQWEIGDFILWNDPTIPMSENQYGYEIDQIADITYLSAGSATFKLARAGSSAATGQAQFGSLMAAHTNANFYRLINKAWVIAIDDTLGPQIVYLPWANMTVAALVVGQQGNSSPILTNLAPIPYLPGTSTKNPRTNPPTPGMRTMNGAAYCSLGISGSLGVGATAANRISAQAWEGIRCVYAKVLTAPTGATSFQGDANACVVIYVCYISPAGVVGLIETLVIDASAFNSYASTNVPDGRQMPYHPYWPRSGAFHDWPPNWLPTCAGALTAGGLLQLGTPPALPNVPSGTGSVQFSPDGAIDFIVAQVGTTIAGANLTVAVQT